MTTETDSAAPPTIPGQQEMIPPEARPTPSPDDEGSSGDTDPLEPPPPRKGGKRDYAAEGRRRRQLEKERREASGEPRRGPGRPKGSGAGGGVGSRNALGGVIFYGGIGAILQGVGIAPAAGMTMTALSDEAGPEIAKWAKQRSPRFYRFLGSLADISGPGTYIGAPLLAEAHARTPMLRPVLDKPLELAVGEQGANAVRAIGVELYDPAREEREQERRRAAAEHAAMAGAGAGDQVADPEPEAPA